MKHLVIAAIVLAAGTSYAQIPALYECIYEYQMQGEGKNGEFSRTYNCILQIGKEHSKFYDYAQFRTDSVAQVPTAGDDIKAEIESSRLKAENYYDELIFNSIPDKNISVYADIVPDRYKYDETTPVMTWEITADKDTVCGYECHKAEATYGGRRWIAWYTEDIPVPFGPWKLTSLPGLVLKAEDSTGNHRFEAICFRNATGCIIPDNTPNVIGTKHDKFMARKNSYDLDPYSIIQPEQISDMTVINHRVIINGFKIPDNSTGFVPLEITDK